MDPGSNAKPEAFAEASPDWWRGVNEVEKLAGTKALLTSAVLCDVLDQFGMTHQFLPPQIRALRDDFVLAGRAMPVVIGDVFGDRSKPFGQLTEALDQLAQNDVYLAHSGRIPCAAWGEILTATAISRGAAGAVIDGYHRDTIGVLKQSWPVFSWGAYGQDAGARSAVVEYRVPVRIGEVDVTPGDLVFGDVDGVIVVPASIEDEVLAAAVAKRHTEGTVLDVMADGMTSTEAFARFGVL